MDLKLLTESIRKLEISLHQPETRKDVSMLNKLLADEFIEISKSGKLWTKSEIIKDLANETGAEITSTDFSLSILSENIVLITYTAHQSAKAGSSVITSKRSSIWKLFGNEWKMIFHQGTPII